MPINAIQLAAVRDELSAQIIGKRIEKIQQPQRDMLILTLRGFAKDSEAEAMRESQRLLISVGTGDARVHLTEDNFDNPSSPPMFCMLLRKYLTGARVSDVIQPPGERIIEIILTTSNRLVDVSEKRLVIELFGRVPNIILVDENGIITDCFRRISGDIKNIKGVEYFNRRIILPGLKYQPPPPPPASPPSELSTLGSPTESISQMFDRIYTKKSKEENMRLKRTALVKTMKTAQKRIERKLSIQKIELQETTSRDYSRQCGDIIMANLHIINKGDDMVVADDFYASEDEKRTIQLDTQKTPQENAARYYKIYTKLRNAAEHLSSQIARGEKELEYVESVLEQLTRAANEQELDEIRSELEQTRYVKVKKAKKEKAINTKPMEFKSTSGMQILVGKNNMQNDFLTFKTASKSDIWLHTQKIHSAHVIIRTNYKDMDEGTLREAASIAAYYSAARGKGRVPVDYTLVKFVKKPPSTRPGMVIYTKYKTVIAQSDDGLVESLRTGYS